ncbi:MAG: hypothetical protein NTW78_01920 [Campylobacterales bacterium]|nr:hypothetical protein [Campylobacterales bacterium]
MSKLRQEDEEFANRFILFAAAIFIVYEVYIVLLIGTLLLAFKVIVLDSGKYPGLEAFVDDLF